MKGGRDILAGGHRGPVPPCLQAAETKMMYLNFGENCI